MQSVYNWFWRLLPGNPMVVRIVQGGSTRVRDMWVRMIYLGVLIGLVLIGLLVGGGFGGEMNLTELAKSGTKVFAVISYGQVVLVCLITPLFMAAAIAQEQSSKTYDILLTTPLSNLQIVLGALAGRLFFVLALLASGLPLFAVLLIFGGVPVQSVFISFAVAGVTALLVGSVAVTLSVMRAGGRKAVFVFVIGVAAYLVAVYALDWLLLRYLMPFSQSTTWLTPLHPLLVLEASLNSANYRPPAPELIGHYPWIGRFYLGRPFEAFMTMGSLASLTMLVWCAVVLRNVGQGESKLGRWFATQLRIGGAKGGERQHKPRKVTGRNPIAWREAHTRGNAVGGIIARWGFAVLGLALGAVWLILYHLDLLPQLPNKTGGMLMRHEVFLNGLVVIMLLEVAVITLVALYMSAGCVSREREDGTLDLLLATPMTPRQYVWGKLRGLVSFLALLIAVPVLTAVMGSVYALVGFGLGWEQATFLHKSIAPHGAQLSHEPLLMMPEAGLLLVVMLVPFVALCVATGMNWSLKAKTVLGAVIPSVAIIGALSLVLGLCGWNMAQGVVMLGPVVNAFSPATNLMMVVNPWGSPNGLWTGISSFGDSQLAGRISLGIGALVAAGGYSLVVYAMILGMVKGFDQTVRRLSGTG